MELPLSSCCHQSCTHQPPRTSTLLTVIFEGLLDSYTDEQLLQYFQQSPKLVTTRNESVRILSPSLIVKPHPSNMDYNDELSALELAHTRGIRVPGVRRVVRGEHLLIMDRIHGLTLEQLWPNLGWLDTFRIAWQLRSFLCIMRSITSQTTSGVHTDTARSEWLQDVYGSTPHASPSAFSASDFSNAALIGASRAQTSCSNPPPNISLFTRTLHLAT